MPYSGRMGRTQAPRPTGHEEPAAGTVKRPRYRDETEAVEGCQFIATPTMTTTLAFLLALLLLPVLVLLWATESKDQRAKRLRSYGWTQRRIAEHLGISLYATRKALAA